MPKFQESTKALVDGIAVVDRVAFADRAAVVLSAGCLVHCLLLPLIVPTLPLLSAYEDEWLHVFFAPLLFGIAAFTFLRGFRIHRTPWIVISGLVGVSFLAVAVSLPHPTSVSSPSTILTCVGSLVLIFAHLSNIRQCKCSFSSSSCACED